MNSASRAEKVLTLSLERARFRFNAAEQSGRISGTFLGRAWSYKGSQLPFATIGEGKRSSGMTPLDPIADQLCRCFIAFEISKGNGKASAALIVGRLNAFRHLAKTVQMSDAKWHELNSAILKRAVEHLRGHGLKESTVYNRAGGLQAFVNFLNRLEMEDSGERERFLGRNLSWRHKVKNPIHSVLELTSPEHHEHTENKFRGDLHIALSSAHAAIMGDPSLEPRPGYDRIRLEALAFPMALGIRIGETCSLPIDVVDDSDGPEYAFARIATEKTGDPRAKVVPAIWVDALKQADLYLTETCASARARAKEIEESGFAFVARALKEFRKENSLTRSRVAQLKVDGLDPERHFFIDEITSVFPLSVKQFKNDSVYGSCSVALAKPVAAQVVEWLDDRFAQWDWAEFSRQKYQRNGLWNVSTHTLSEDANINAASIKKSEWFADDLRQLLSDMKAAGLFAPKRARESSEMDAWRRRWHLARAKFLSRRGGAQCFVCNVDAFTDVLARRYAGWLSKHFEEEFDEEGNASGGGFSGNKVRRGMEPLLSDHLIVVWEHQFTEFDGIGILPRPLLRADIYNYLSSNAQKRTVFERLNLTNEMGVIWSFTPHMIRHWVSSAMLRAGMNEAAVDMWMDRAPGQTRSYDHRTAKERAEAHRSAYLDSASDPPNDYLGRRVAQWRADRMAEHDIERLVIEKLKVMHYTPFGTCSRELNVSPCQRSVMCLRGFGTGAACESFHIDPVDMEAKKRIEKLLHDNQQLLSKLAPNQDELAELFKAEMDSSEPLDQHIQFLLDINRGCRDALAEYAAAECQRRPIDLKVIE